MRQQKIRKAKREACVRKAEEEANVKATRLLGAGTWRGETSARASLQEKERGKLALT